MDPSEGPPYPVTDERLAALEPLDPRQVAIWRAMAPWQKAQIVFDAFQMALDMVRANERQLHPDLSEAELALRVARRMSGDPNLGRGKHGKRSE
jgi:hypothetical protein